jgi:cysteine-rich repeat protein
MLDRNFLNDFNKLYSTHHGNFSQPGDKKGAFMKKVWLGAVAFILLAGLPMTAQGQPACAGDCDGTDIVGINELITCVGISLGNLDLSVCTACDPSGDGDVGINELILAVGASLCGCPGCETRPTPTPGDDPICGNNRVETGEECDDGNIFGGDACAANCTEEIEPLRGNFDTVMTTATVQNSGVQIPVRLSGGQTFRAGKARDEVVLGEGGVELFQPGEIPVVIKASELNFNPVAVSTVACACVRAIEVPALLGPGNAATGVIGCGPNGLMDIDYRVIQDHNTNPGDEFNVCKPADGGAPDDPECNDESGIDIPGNPTVEGPVSRACREQSGDDRCDDATRFLHPGTCNSPRILTRSGGPAQRGSVFIVNNTAISLLLDGAVCCGDADTPECGGGGQPACIPEYGPDCKACTDDDLDQQPANTLPATSGVAEAAVYDLNNGENATEFGVCMPDSNVTIDADNGPNGCAGGGSAGPGCITRVQGTPIDCDLLDGPNPEEALQGASLVVAFPSIDADLIKDTVTTTTFFNE